MADIKNFGIKGIAADVQMGKSGGRLKYDAVNSRFDLTQSDGSTLEDLRVGTITSGSWNGSAISTQYGGTGQDFSSATGIISLSNGTASAGALDLSNASFVSGVLSVSNGGTGSNTAAGARTNLGLGTLATQDANAVSITSGSLDGVTIGGSSAGAITGTTIIANSGFTGNLTGTASNATVLATARYFSASGDASATGVSFDGSANVDLGLTLATVNSNVGSFGSTTAIPVITVNAKGLVTAVSTASIATSMNIAGDTGTDTVDLASDTLTFAGSGGLTAAVTNNTVTYSIVDGASIANLTVTGTFTSDDITSSQVTVDGDAVITGNLTVNGTQTIVNSTVVSVDDAVFRVNSDGTSQSAGLEANIAGTIESVVYNPVTSRWELSGPVQTSDGFVGNLTGDVTGTASNASALTSAVTVALSGDASGSATFVNAGDTATISTTLANTAVTAGNYGSATQIPTFTVDSKGRITAASNVNISTSWTMSGDSGSETVNGGDTVTVAGGTNINTEVTATDTVTINLDPDVTLSGNLSAVNVTGSGKVQGATLTDGTLSSTAGTITGGVAATFSGAVEGGSLTDGTATLSSGALSGATSGTFSGAVTGGSLTDGTATLSGGNLTGAGNVTASGTVTGATLTDGTLSSTAGNVTGAVNITASGAVTGGSLTDGSATLASGSLTGANNITASGTVQFGALTDGSVTINAILDEDNMASDSATAVPTQQSVKAYVDALVTAQDLDGAGDTGTFAVDLDSQSLTIAGGTNINTAGSGQTLTVNLDTSLSGLTSVTSTSFTGNLTGNVSGNLTGEVTGNVSGNAGTATTLATARYFSASGDASATGVSFDGSANVDLALTLASTGVTAKTYGSTTEIPVLTIDAKGRITAASNASIATSFDIAGDNGSNDTVNGGETLSILGASGQVETTITNNTVTVGIVDGASIANLTVTGTFTSDDITSSSVTIAGDAIISGNLTVQGTQTTVNSTTVETADAIFRTNSNGANTDAGFEANTASGVKQILYTAAGSEWDFGSENVKATSFEGSLTGNADSATALATARTFSASGDATASGVNFDGSANVDLALTLATVNSDVGTYGNATLIPSITVNAKGLVTGVTTNAVASSLGTAGDSGTGTVDLLSQSITIAGGTNLTSSASGQTITVDLDNDVTLTGNLSAVNGTFSGTITDGTLSATAGNVTGAVNITASGEVSFGSLTDSGESITVTKFVDEADGISSNDNDTTIPTSAAVKDYVDNNGGDGLLLRTALTNGSTTIDTSAVPNVSSRTYYAEKIVIKIGTAFSGGSFNHILVKENAGSGTTLIAAADADAATAGTYIIELDGDATLTKNAAVQVQFMQADGVTAATTTAGAGTISVHYNYV